jgi:hypothetical protein
MAKCCHWQQSQVDYFFKIPIFQYRHCSVLIGDDGQVFWIVHFANAPSRNVVACCCTAEQRLFDVIFLLMTS